MTDKEKLEKIRSEVIWYIHLRNEGLIIGSCGDFEKLLKFIDSMQEEPVSEQNLSNVERIGKDWKEEPVSEDFKKFEEQYLEKEKDEIISVYDRHAGLVDGAQWQKKQMMKDAIERVVKVDAGGYPYIDGTIELYDYSEDKPLAKAGDKVKIIIVKED